MTVATKVIVLTELEPNPTNTQAPRKGTDILIKVDINTPKGKATIHALKVERKGTSTGVIFQPSEDCIVKFSDGSVFDPPVNEVKLTKGTNVGLRFSKLTAAETTYWFRVDSKMRVDAEFDADYLVMRPTTGTLLWGDPKLVIP